MRNIVYRLSVIVLLAFVFLQTTYAVESTPSADIKSKLEELKKQIASKAAKLKQDVNRKLKDKAYVGIIQSKSDNSYTISTPSGSKTVSVNVDTIFESNIKGKQKFSSKTIALGDFIAGLGDVDETKTLIARKVILLPQNQEKPKIALWGQVISVSDDLITIKDKEKENAAVSLPKSSKVSIGDIVILTGTKDKNNIFDAEYVYTFPGIKAKIQKRASPSANLKETPGATSAAIKKIN